MINIEKNYFYAEYQRFFHINHNNNRIWKFQTQIQNFQLNEYSTIIRVRLFNDEAKCNIKINNHSDLIIDNKQKHSIFVDFVNAIHY